MAVFNPNVTAVQAASQLKQDNNIGVRRKAAPLANIIKDAMYARRFYIHNVGPWPQTVNSGSTGYFNIPACKKGEKYATMIEPVWAAMEEQVPRSAWESDRLFDDGWQFILQIMNEGQGQNPKFTLRRFGMFPSENEVPTEEELYKAKKELEAECARIVSEIRNIYATDRKLFSNMMKDAGAYYYKAAEILNLTDEVWMTDNRPSGRTKCGFCGTMNDPDVALCLNCKEIIDPVKYQALKAKQAESSGELKRSPGRPRKEEVE